MSDQNSIDHEGIVEAISGDVARVKIDAQSACAACHAKGVCTAADKEEKIMEVPLNGVSLNPGEKVRVLISRHTGLRAVAIGYFYPFLLLIILLITLTSAGMNELRAGLFSLAALVPYYLGVFLLRNQIDKAFTFRLEKTTMPL